MCLKSLEPNGKYFIYKISLICAPPISRHVETSRDNFIKHSQVDLNVVMLEPTLQFHTGLNFLDILYINYKSCALWD